MELGSDVQSRHGGQLVGTGVNIDAVVHGRRASGANPTVDSGSACTAHQNKVAIEEVHGHADDLAIVAKVIDDAVAPFADLGPPLACGLRLHRHLFVLLAVRQSSIRTVTASRSGLTTRLRGLRAEGGGVHGLAGEHGPQLIFYGRCRPRCRRRRCRRRRCVTLVVTGTATETRLTRFATGASGSSRRRRPRLLKGREGAPPAAAAAVALRDVHHRSSGSAVRIKEILQSATNFSFDGRKFGPMLEKKRSRWAESINAELNISAIREEEQNWHEMCCFFFV